MASLTTLRWEKAWHRAQVGPSKRLEAARQFDWRGETAFFTLGGLGLLVTALLALCVHVPPAKADDVHVEVSECTEPSP